MVVLCLTNCQPALRGDLTRWLMEIDTGVYAGNVSARVREELWNRVTENIKDGRATMVYSARTEQKMEFRVHNNEWIPVDFDGMKLMLRPNKTFQVKSERTENRMGYSKASAIRKAKRFAKHVQNQKDETEGYVVFDVETTGLSSAHDRIIEIGAIKVIDGVVAEQFERLIKQDMAIPNKVKQLTGITEEMVGQSGVDEKTALKEVLNFIGDKDLVMHNAAFDFNFLRQTCRRHEEPIPTNKVTDTLRIAKQNIKDIDDYKLSTLAKYFGIENMAAHRALSDCHLTKHVYEKLIEK